MSFLDPGTPVRIKICGITSRADAEMSVDAGANAFGFNFYRGSKRCISFEESRAWIASLAGRASRVAVVVNAAIEEVHALRDSGCFEAVQFHGDETPEFCARAGFPAWIRAVRVRGQALAARTPFYTTPPISCSTPGRRPLTAARGAALTGTLRVNSSWLNPPGK